MQDLPDRLDPALGAVGVDDVDAYRCGPLSSAEKNADADRNIAFHHRSSRFSRCSTASLSASVLVVPGQGRCPGTTSACVTQPRNVSGSMTQLLTDPPTGPRIIAGVPRQL